MVTVGFDELVPSASFGANCLTSVYVALSMLTVLENGWICCFSLDSISTLTSIPYIAPLVTQLNIMSVTVPLHNVSFFVFVTWMATLSTVEERVRAAVSGTVKTLCLFAVSS